MVRALKSSHILPPPPGHGKPPPPRHRGKSGRTQDPGHREDGYHDKTDRVRGPHRRGGTSIGRACADLWAAEGTRLLQTIIQADPLGDLTREAENATTPRTYGRVP